MLDLIESNRRAAERHAAAVQRNLHKLVPHPWLPSDVTCPEVQITARDWDPIVGVYVVPADRDGRLSSVVGEYQRVGGGTADEPWTTVYEGDTCEIFTEAWWHPVLKARWA